MRADEHLSAQDMPEQDTETNGDEPDGLVGAVQQHRAALSVYLKGFAMGAAATVPGVSAGTIALIAGIYDRFILALTNLEPSLLGLLPGLATASGRERFTEEFVERELFFLLLLFLGLASAVVTLARLLNAVLTQYPGPTFAFFGGLIAASAAVLYDRRWLARREHALALVAGFSVAFVVTGATETGLFPETPWMVFLAAMVAISGMVLPGLSGSFILLILGQYEYLTGVLTSFTDSLAALLTGGEPENLVGDGLVIAVFLAGAITGFLTVAHGVRAALDRYPGSTFAFLVSLMVGALRFPLVQTVEETEPAALPVAIVILAAIAGAALVLILERSTVSIGYDAYAPDAQQ